jgi:hypothetical protein
MVQACPGIKGELTSKITKVTNAGCVGQVVKCLPGRFKALRSNPSIAKKNYVLLCYVLFHSSMVKYTYNT